MALVLLLDVGIVIVTLAVILLQILRAIEVCMRVLHHPFYAELAPEERV